jgi:ketosteroid isomerase-like protein
MLDDVALLEEDAAGDLAPERGAPQQELQIHGEVLELLPLCVAHDGLRLAIGLHRQALLIPAERFCLLGERRAETGERSGLVRQLVGRLVVLVEAHVRIVAQVAGQGNGCLALKAYELTMARTARLRAVPRRLGLRDTCVAMSQQNVELVRDSWTALATGGLDAMAEFWDEEISWRAIEDAPDDVGEMHGVAAARRYVQDWLDMFEDIVNVPQELLDVGDERVIAVQHVTGRARLSGIETELRYAVVYTLRDGKIVRVKEYRTREQALDAVGLSR